MTTAIVCGGRDYNDYEFVRITLDEINEFVGLTRIIEGGARGADSLARRWALEANVELVTVYAEWDRYGKSAGYKRNVKMADLNPDLIIAYPGGRGTQMMKDIGTQRGIRVITPANR